MVNRSRHRWSQRIADLSDAIGPISARRMPSEPADCLVAVCSSRLGRDLERRRGVCQFLTRCIQDCRHRGGTLVVASGSAIEPWAKRAAELFSVRLITMSIHNEDDAAELILEPADPGVGRDALAVAIADRVDALFVRRGGTLQQCLRNRIDRRHDATTRVAFSADSRCAAAELVAGGAVGWFQSSGSSPRSCPDVDDTNGVDEAWTRTDGRWLVHCTRGHDGAWPGETERQFRDAMILGRDHSARRGPLDTLHRIIKTRRLVASATATRKAWPVVCFSAVPLQELLQRRCFRPQLGRWDYEPYGIALQIDAARSLGIAPVIYGDPGQGSALPPQQRYRFHPKGRTYDWRHEREWRSCESVDLGSLNPSDVRVFAAATPEARRTLEGCRWPVTFLAEPVVEGV